MGKSGVIRSLDVWGPCSHTLDSYIHRCGFQGLQSSGRAPLTLGPPGTEGDAQLLGTLDSLQVRESPS